MQELISIIIPIYNVEKYLEKCIDSVINQTYKNLEILLIDDGSLDNSGKICDEYKIKDKRIKVIHKKNGGLSDARNCGIENSTGIYIGFVDGDDYIDSKMYEILYSNIKNKDAYISICKKIIENENKPMPSFYSNDILVMNREKALIQLNYIEKYDMSSCDKLFKKELFNNIRFPYGFKNEDLFIMYKLFFKSERVVYTPSCLYHYIQRKESISKEHIIDDYYIKACEEQLIFFKENCSNLLFAAETMLLLAFIFQYNRYIVYKLKCPKNEKRKYRKYVYKNRNHILKNKAFSIKRKIQVLLFCYLPVIYYFIIKFKNMQKYAR